MTQPDKLTIKEVERITLMGMGGDSFDNICKLAKQLADIMRENEFLHKEIQEYEKASCFNTIK